MAGHHVRKTSFRSSIGIERDASTDMVSEEKSGQRCIICGWHAQYVHVPRQESALVRSKARLVEHRIKSVQPWSSAQRTVVEQKIERIYQR